VTTDDAGLHAANLAALQLLLADAGGWPHEQGDGWVAADAAAATRFFSFTVLTRDGAQPAPTVYGGRSGPTGWVEMDLWGRAAPGETRHPVLMRREPAPLPPADPRVTVARTAEQLREAQVQLAVGLEAPGLHGVLGEGLLDHPVACAYAPSACAVAFDDGTTVGVYLVGTATAARGRGLGTAVTAGALAALPERPALLTATTAGRPVYERLGFRVVGRATMRIRERFPLPQ
jgi:GNAT superfamily N-acetyltransferase